MVNESKFVRILRYTLISTYNVNTAISVSDDLFASAEDLARRVGVTRSEIYVRALRDYVLRHDSEHVRAVFDAVYAVESSSIDPDMMAAQVEVRSEWEE
jgi:metal-responsive CopG/Arc/MetJ family transcriptional regulator